MSEANLFVAGGAIPPGKAFYIERAVDVRLLDACRRGQIAYLLGSRQMGKSSLIARALQQLRSEAFLCAFVDLSITGSTGSMAEWFATLLDEIAYGLDVVATDDQLRTAAACEPRFVLSEFFNKVVLPERKGRIVVFIDEVDRIPQLEYAGALFSALRVAHGRNAKMSPLGDVSFVLSGVALHDTIEMAHLHGIFAIGVSIDPADFTREEIQSAAQYLPCPTTAAIKLLDRVLYWTDGHPYLTMRICYVLAEQLSDCSDAAVDQVVDASLLSCVDRDSNLRFVADMLTSHGPETLLEYWKVLRGAVVTYEPTPVHDWLRLSGVVRIVDGVFKVRNRVYETVFNEKWVGEHVKLPLSAKLRNALNID